MGICHVKDHSAAHFYFFFGRFLDALFFKCPSFSVDVGKYMHRPNARFCCHPVPSFPFHFAPHIFLLKRWRCLLLYEKRTQRPVSALPRNHTHSTPSHPTTLTFRRPPFPSPCSCRQRRHGHVLARQLARCVVVASRSVCFVCLEG